MPTWGFFSKWRIDLFASIAYLTRSQAYPTGRPEATFISLVVSWILGAIITTFFFKKGKWRETSITKE